MANKPDSKNLNTLADSGLKPKAPPFIILENVTLQINSISLFQNLTWAMGSGEHWAIVGPNGSGKSTLAQAICHEIPLGEGRIVYFFDNDGLGAGANTPVSSQQGRLFFNPGEIIMISPQAHQELARRYSSYHLARWQSFEGTGAPVVADFLSGKSIEVSIIYVTHNLNELPKAISHVLKLDQGQVVGSGPWKSGT